ncbi:MAG: hypothetical protein JNM68_13880, partial [Dinghuibacter sp.]|nr:hypothetical protein [Dinghuibacter sp.]
MIKKSLRLLALVSTGLIATPCIHAQNVGIGTVTPTAQLHVNGTVRLENLPLNNSYATLLGMDASGNLGRRNADFWGLAGNTGTNPATNFIGTTDNNDVVFRVNNAERARIHNLGAFVVGGATANNVINTGAWSTFVAGTANTINFAEKSIVLGWNNTANTHNQYLIGVSNSATNEYGFAIGIDLRSNADKAFVIGTGTSGAKLTNNQTHSLLIGFTGSNSMFINSSGVGINNVSPTARLHVSGTVRLDGLPQGTSDSALVIDAAGNVRWKTITGGGGAGWGLTGNSGTNPATNFLGTTDNNDVVIRVNNAERARAHNLGAFVVGGATAGNVISSSAWSTFVAGTANSVTFADKSIVMGWNNAATNHNQYLIGVSNTATNEYGFTIGLDLRSNADKAFVIGTGTFGNKLTNSNTQSLLIGFSGSQSLFINNSSAAVFTTTPTQRFHVKCDTTLANGGIRFENLAAGAGYYLTVDANGNLRRSNEQSTARVAGNAEVLQLRKELDETRKELEALKKKM